jgi:hypothetical protein
MALNSDRRRQVAAMRAETRAYLHDIRVRRLAPPAEPAPAEASRPPDPAAPAAFLPDPDIAALSPAALPPAPDRRPVATDYSLDALRLLGHGMVWRLNKLGVHTLHDLAACNPERLGESLGPIGRLVRCEVWVQAAREILLQD